MAKALILSTTESLEGWTITQHLGVLSGHVVAGTSIFGDFVAGFSDVFGGRSETYQRYLHDIQSEVIGILSRKASNIGANAIVGLRIDHDEISGKGKAMFMVTAYGTAVRVERKTEDSCSIPTTRSTIDAQEMRLLARKIRRVREAEAGQIDLNSETIDVICQLRSPAFCDMFVSKLSLAKGSLSPELTEHAVKYFQSLKDEDATGALYTLAENGVDFALKMIRERHLVDLERTLIMLLSDNDRTARRALEILTWEKGGYDSGDVASLEHLKGKILERFPERPLFEVKGLFSKTSVKWQCICGTSNDPSVSRCTSCNSDRRGFEASSTCPDYVVDLLDRRISVLTELFGLQ